MRMMRLGWPVEPEENATIAGSPGAGWVRLSTGPSVVGGTSSGDYPDAVAPHLGGGVLPQQAGQLRCRHDPRDMADAGVAVELAVVEGRVQGDDDGAETHDGQDVDDEIEAARQDDGDRLPGPDAGPGQVGHPLGHGLAELRPGDGPVAPRRAPSARRIAPLPARRSPIVVGGPFTTPRLRTGSRPSGRSSRGGRG